MPLAEYPYASQTAPDPQIYALKIVGDLPTEEEAISWFRKAGPDQIVLVICEDRRTDEFEKFFQQEQAVLCGERDQDFLYNHPDIYHIFGPTEFDEWRRRADATQNGTIEADEERAKT